MYISIHSTARVETKVCITKLAFDRISIHSTARVETWGPLDEAGYPIKISIHSTARVET